VQVALAAIAIALAGCASSLPANLERAMLDAAEAPRPACQSGHDAALRDGVVTIRPGQTVCVQLRLDGSVVVPETIVSVADPESTLILKAWLDADNSDTFLTLHNPLDVFLRYEASMLVPSASRHEYTSSCPVLSRRLSMEHWPYPIDELTLRHFSAEPESETIECR